MIIVAYVLATTALYYLGSRARITSFLWSRYPKWLDTLMLCSACVGAWFGFALGGLGAWREWSYLGLPGRDGFTVALVGLGSMVWTPIMAALHLWALDRVAAAPPEPEPPDEDRDAA